jgi:hypothetical protein
MGRCFEDSVNWIINLISLAENVVTTIYFDEDTFGTINLALVFCFEPILDACVKQLMFCTECDWDNFVYDLISEGIQCFLYLYFCSYNETAKLVLPLMMAAQVFLMIVLKVKEKCCDEPEEKGEEQKAVEGMVRIVGCVQANCMTLCTSIFPLFYLLYQEEAPYRQKSFEIVLACYYWIADIAMQYQFQAMEEAAGGDESKLSTLAQNKSWELKFANLSQLAFVVYTSVLAWQYWFSDDIKEDFDKGYTMFTMVMSCIMGCCLPCALLQGVMGKGQEGEGHIPADIIGKV